MKKNPYAFIKMLRGNAIDVCHKVLIYEYNFLEFMNRALGPVFAKKNCIEEQSIQVKSKSDSKADPKDLTLIHPK